MYLIKIKDAKTILNTFKIYYIYRDRKIENKVTHVEGEIH